MLTNRRSQLARPPLGGRSIASSSKSLRHRILTAAVTLSIAGGFFGSMPSGSVVAQDGTGAATPTPPTNCVVVPSEVDLATYGQTPQSAPETPAPGPTTEPETPLASPAGSPQASPIVSDNATPDASPVVADEVKTPAAAAQDDALEQELTATANSIVSCMNESNTSTFLTITSPTYLGQLTGIGGRLDDETYTALVPTFPAVDNRIVSLTGITIVDEATATATVTYVHAYQQRTSTWTFVQEVVDGEIVWTLDAEAPLLAEVPNPATAVDLTIRGNAYKLSSTSIDGPDIVFNINNRDKVDHEALILRFDDGVTTDDLLQATGPALPDGVELIGQATVPAGTSGDMVLADLPNGTYTIVCLLPTEQGLPYLSDGMTTTFKVT